MKYTLLLDSSDVILSVGLADENSVIDSISYEAWQCQSEHMIPEIDKLLTKYNVNRNDIESVMVAVGPGSYTGVRIALTIAKTIAVALNVDVYPVSSLQILKCGKKCSICLINARSNRSYFGVFQGERAIEKDQILTNDKVIEYINDHPDYVVCGNTKYLGIDGYQANISIEMFSLKEFISRSENSLGVKPIYMKD